MPVTDTYELYLALARHVLGGEDAQEANNWQKLQQHLSALHNALTCLVCSGVLATPMASPGNVCAHRVCRDCVDLRTKENSCVACHDVTALVEDKMLQTLLLCYRQLCIVLADDQNLLKSIDNNNDGYDLLNVINRGIAVNTHEQRSGEASMLDLAAEPHSQVHDALDQSASSNSHIDELAKSASMENTNALPNCFVELKPVITNDHDYVTCASVRDSPKPRDKSTSLHKSRATPNTNQTSLRRKTSKAAIRRRRLVMSSGKMAGARSSYNKEKPQQRRGRSATSGCNCGQAAVANPGRLTCCGQRCPCYSAHRSCVSCNCRGCRNTRTPQQADDVSVNVVAV